MQSSSINRFFEDYIKRNDRKKELDSELFEVSNKEKWVESLKNRSAEIRQMYLANMEVISELENYLTMLIDSNAKIDDEIAIALYDGVMSMYYEDCDDIYLTPLIMDIILNYFVSKKDFNRIINLHAVCYYQKAEILDRLGYEVPTDDLITELSAILGYKIFYKMLSEEARKKIFSSYYNLGVVSVDTHKLDMDTSYYCIKELIEFYHSPMVQNVEKENEEIKAHVDRVPREWLGYTEEIGHASVNVQEYYMELSDALYAEEVNSGKIDAQITYEIYSSHVLTMCLRKQISYVDGFYKLAEYYLARRKYLKEMHKEQSVRLYEMSQEHLDYLYYFINQPMTTMAWIQSYQIEKEVFMPYIKTYLEDLHQVWTELYQAFPSSFLDQFVINVSISIIKYMDSDDEKMKWLKKLLVKRDLTTYIHSTMVAKLAILIGQAIIKEVPEIFMNAFHYSTSEIVEKEDEILQYIENAAYFHDVGKTRMGDIINTQTRKISDLEFNLIKSHPDKGLDVVNQIELLAPYKDVIVGHHKNYDGKGGYPASFDNTKSWVRPIIDLITVCDCIDAATDILGRNYAQGKDSDVVIREIVAGAGTRYNPEIARFISENEGVKSAIHALTTTGRIDCYYDIYEEYFTK